ncbi:MAG TPA: VOC family protein [Acidimicrobiia bacterium]|nr:VOC family protein [Acidimicrobiia bacterium]
MTIKLNHTIVFSRDKDASSTFLTNLFGLPAPVPFGPFLGVEVGNEVTLDFYDEEGQGTPQHYAFLVGEDEFDQIFGRVKARGIDYWADPGHRLQGEINTHDGGRGVYFDDPSGHILEIITRPYSKAR